MRSTAFWLATLLLAGGCYAPQVDLQRNFHPSDADLTVTRVVHGALVLEVSETRILVDPWYSPSAFLGHGEAIGISLENLPDVAGLLITDDRSDHFDPRTIARLNKEQSRRVVVPAGLASRADELGRNDVVALDPWETTQIGAVRVTAVPSTHGRSSAGYILEGGGLVVYVAGGTAFEPKLFWAIAESFPKIDVALLPIGGNRAFGFLLDMSPDQAARAASILKPRYVVPMHYGLIGPVPFLLRNSKAVADFKTSVSSLERLPPDLVVELRPGESWHHYK